METTKGTLCSVCFTSKIYEISRKCVKCQDMLAKLDALSARKVQYIGSACVKCSEDLKYVETGLCAWCYRKPGDPRKVSKFTKPKNKTSFNPAFLEKT